MSVRMHFFLSFLLLPPWPPKRFSSCGPHPRFTSVPGCGCSIPHPTAFHRGPSGWAGAAGCFVSQAQRGREGGGRVAALSGSIRPPMAPHPAHSWQSLPRALRQEGSPGLAMPGLSQPLDRLEAVLLPPPPGVSAARGEVRAGGLGREAATGLQQLKQEPVRPA